MFLRLRRQLGDRTGEAPALLGILLPPRPTYPTPKDTWQQALDILEDLHHLDAVQVRAKFG
ncbi:MAG: hypothetical protein WAN00_03255 [Trebonia sp.]